MKRKCLRVMEWACLLTVCAYQGCAIDPDIGLRAAVSFGSDAAIFVLENLATAI